MFIRHICSAVTPLEYFVGVVVLKGWSGVYHVVYACRCIGAVRMGAIGGRQVGCELEHVGVWARARREVSSEKQRTLVRKCRLQPKMETKSERSHPTAHF